MIGNKIIRYDSVTSTNDICRQLIGNGDPEGVIVTAEEQTAGRGRLKRLWFSPRGAGLYFSVIICPKAARERPALYTVAASLSVVKTLDEFSHLSSSIKWPNDIIAGGKKLSGMLAEQKGGYLIVGVGINLNNDKGSFPPELQRRATSVKIETGKDTDKSALLQKYLEIFEDYCFGLEKAGAAGLIEEARGRSSTIGTTVEIERSGSLIKGKAVGLDESGALIIELSDGKIITVHSGDILCRQEV